MSLNLNTLEEIITALKLRTISFDQAIRMILTLKAQGLSDEEIEEKAQGVVIEDRNLLNSLNTASLRLDGDEVN